MNTKPPNAGKGRPKGSPNKMTRDLRELVEGALEDAGGREYLARQARDNPTAFMALLKGLLPRQISADIKAQTEIVDKRREIDAMVEALLAPGAVQRTRDGAPVVNLPPVTPSEARLNRADGRGAPIEISYNHGSCQSDDA